MSSDHSDHSDHLDIDTFTAETAANFAAMTLAQLIRVDLRERNNRGAGPARGIVLQLLRDELTKRSMAVETIRETGVDFLEGA